MPESEFVGWASTAQGAELARTLTHLFGRYIRVRDNYVAPRTGMYCVPLGGVTARRLFKDETHGWVGTVTRLASVCCLCWCCYPVCTG